MKFIEFIRSFGLAPARRRNEYLMSMRDLLASSDNQDGPSVGCPLRCSQLSPRQADGQAGGRVAGRARAGSGSDRITTDINWEDTSSCHYGRNLKQKP